MLSDLSMVYKIRKKPEKIGGSSRPSNTILRSCHSSTNSLTHLLVLQQQQLEEVVEQHDTTNNTNDTTTIPPPLPLSPLLLPKTTLQRQRSLHQIQMDNEGNIFPNHNHNNTNNNNNSNTTTNNHIPELLFVLKEMDLSMHTPPPKTTTANNNNNNNNNNIITKAQEQQYQLFMNEIAILKTLDHPHIIKIYETFTTSSSPILVFKNMFYLL